MSPCEKMVSPLRYCVILFFTPFGSGNLGNLDVEVGLDFFLTTEPFRETQEEQAR